MRTLLIALTTLMLATSPTLHAQSNDESADEAEQAASREALRAELEQARREVAKAARELARLQRQLADEDIERARAERVTAMEGMEELHEAIRGRRVERIELHTDERFPGLVRPRLGVLLSPEDGVTMIVGVTPGSGAEKAGIKAGDRLISINGLEVDASEPESWRVPMEDLEVGQSVPVVVEREGEQLSFDVAASSPARDIRVITHDIKGPPPAPDAPDAPDAPRVDREVFVLEDGEGLRRVLEHPVPPLPPRLAGLGRNSDMISNHPGLKPYFGTGDGVVVLRIDADNPLQLQDGDVVLSIDGEAVSRPVEIGRALMGRGGETVTLELMRDGERMTIDAELPETRAVSALIQEFGRAL